MVLPGMVCAVLKVRDRPAIQVRSVRWCTMRRLLLPILLILSLPVAVLAQVGVSVTIAPPELVAYEQPDCPQVGNLWTPGYWAYGSEGYFWVPGTWVEPPSVGLLWTPGYWGWREGVYGWNAGYWGPHIGFYGGVNYGYGYGGVGYEGGRWNNGVFAYNRTVNNFGGVSITNVYNQTVINNTNVTRTSFNGGSGGTTVQPTPQEQPRCASSTWPRPPCKLSTSKRRAPTGGCWHPKTMAIRRSRRHPGRLS